MNEERLECGRACVLYACKGVHTRAHPLHQSDRKRERERERERDKRERERDEEREGERERERDVEIVIEFISLLLSLPALKGMTGALAPFSYLVWYIVSLSYG
jgi:hypothetical protein